MNFLELLNSIDVRKSYRKSYGSALCNGLVLEEERHIEMVKVQLAAPYI